MTAFRVLDPFDVFTDSAAQPLSGGEIQFFDTGTTTPKDVFGEKALTTNNGSSVALDSSGRVNVDVWGSGSYRVRVLSRFGVQIGPDRDDVEIPGGGGLVLPSMTGNSGKHLTTNGILALWEFIRQLPDPTGQAGKVVGTDGTVFNFQTGVPTLPATGIADTATSIRIGATLIQLGSDTAPSSGTHTTSKAVTFATAYASAPKVFPISLERNVTPNGFIPTPAVKSITTTGCTVHFDINEGAADAGNNINTAIPFDYIVVGRI